MNCRAQESISRHEMSKYITKARIERRSCNEYALTQPAMTAATPFIAQSPSQAVASDYCEFGGSHYLVNVNRFSNWPSLLCKTWNTCLRNKWTSKCSVILICHIWHS